MEEQEPAAPRQWWARPKLRHDEDLGRHRKVSWLELFFDLVYVVAIAQLSHRLAHHVNVPGVLSFLLLFVPIWWLWISGTIYADRFETDDVGHRAVTFLQMLPVVALAVLSPDGTGATSGAFALAYAAGRVLVVVLWLRGGHYNPPMRPVTHRYAIGFTLSIALFVASVFVPTPTRFALWLVALLIDLVTPLFTARLQRSLPKYSTSRLPERFGLFTIIVLGESITGTVGGLAEEDHVGWRGALTGLFGLALAAGLWWAYFDLVSHRPARPSPLWGFGRNYLHLPLLVAITATGAGVFTLVGSEGEALPTANRLLIAVSVGVALLSLAAISRMTVVPDGQRRVITRLEVLGAVAGALAIAVGIFGDGWGPVATLVLLTAIVAVPDVYGAWKWSHGQLD